MKHLLIIVVAIIAVLFLVVAAWTAFVSRPLYKDMRAELPELPSVAPRERALTFARTDGSLLLVTGAGGEQVEAINLTALFGSEHGADPIELYHAAGYDSLARLEGPREIVDIADLELPLDFGSAHLAAGTNFAEHAEEVRLDDPPFLFPKNIKPTPWNAPVGSAPRLDYEAELAMVPLSDIGSPEEIPAYGLILANDFTDRWTLIRQLKLRQPMGTTGFAAAKGRESYLPTGFFFVIPEDASFYSDIELRLYVNDRLRQRFSASDMILKYPDIAEQAFTDREMHYKKGGATVDLIPPGGTSSGSMILTGTAGGVIFKPVNFWYPRIYLKPGDVVRTEGSWLGHLENRVLP